MIRNHLEHHFHIQTWEIGPHTGARLKAPGILGLEKFPGAAIHAQKSHTPRRFGKTPTLVIVRDPRDVVVSLTHFNRELLEVKSNSLEAGFRSHATNRSWSNFHSYWLHQRPAGGVEFIKYEDCLEHIKAGTMPAFLQAALEALGITAEIQDDTTLPSFEAYHKARPLFYRRGVVGGWRDELSEELAKLCWQNHGPVAKTFGYSE